jgi:hypothetical protein
MANASMTYLNGFQLKLKALRSIVYASQPRLPFEWRA